MTEVMARCPLCDADASRAVDAVDYAAIWQALERAVGVRVPEAVRVRHTPAPTTEVRECAGCGLQRFSPCVPGDSGFYAALDAEVGYYNHWRWEFDVVGPRVATGWSVLDVGCGAGDLLARLGERGVLAEGLELNPTTQEIARARGLAIHDLAVERFAEGAAGRYDLVCSFHVLEHTGDPVGFARAMLRCARPGGAVVLSVPNRDRVWREAIEPFDCPPHHVTRWGDAQLRRLGEIIGAHVVELLHEPAPARELRHAVEKRIEATVARWPLGGRPLGAALGWLASRALLPPLADPLADRYGLPAKLGARGTSTLLWMRRPDVAAGS